MSLSELFWSASLVDQKRGYIEEEECYVCLLCGEKLDKGIVYFEDGLFYTAERHMRSHIKQNHQSVFLSLLSLDKRLTGLTDRQKNILGLFYQGKNDAQIQKELGIGSTSTVRNHRFALKEKERQAKVFLVLMELLKSKDDKRTAYVAPSNASCRVPNRYQIPGGQKIQQKYFLVGPDGPLKVFPHKEKHRLVILRELARRFEWERIYSEQEVNDILQGAYDDYALLRRLLVDYGFLNRKADGSEYWLKKTTREDGGAEMDRKKELKLKYKEKEIPAVVYQIKNIKNQKIFVGSTMNFKSVINGQRFMLEMGSHRNQLLQQDWNEYGPEAFEFEVLETLKKKEEPYFDVRDALAKLEEKWLDRLQPYGERGYNKKP
ncbi:MAG: DUF2087 domain-containing protein [bacterium]|jgi:hypothetical protein